MRSLLLCLSLLAAGCSAASASPTAAPSSAAATFVRSSVAGTWNVSVSGGSTPASFVLHLHGPDEALTGAASYGGAQITGDVTGGTLRLNLLGIASLITSSGGASYSTGTLLDCALSSDGHSATGTAVGNLNGNVTMTRQ